MASTKLYSSPEAALADVFDGAVILIGGFAGSGVPQSLLRALHHQGHKELTCVFYASTGSSPIESLFDVSRLVENGQVRKVVSPMPFYPGTNSPVEKRWKAGELDIEVVPQGVLAERLRAGGVGLGGVFLPTGVGTRFDKGKEQRQFDGQDCLLEMPLKADFALIRADAADTLGNLTYQGTQRSWGPVMAMSASITVAEVDHVCEPGGIDPELVITPGIFVNRIVQTTG